MDKLPPKQKKLKGATREELIALDKNQLVEKIIQLEAHNTQLKNIISRNLSADAKDENPRKNKPFDFSKCSFRRILLHILYFGWDYQGLAVQEDSNETIEHYLFHALTKACLIERRESSQYHRCGRTDKGVSAFGQVISITVRSKLEPSEQKDFPNELPYCKILNRLLPKEIRAVAWAPIPDHVENFSARFDCKRRQYKYYFPRCRLDISAMRVACRSLIGSHDFRHLCKMDVGNGVTEFRREIFTADILPAEKESDTPTSMYYLLIEGNAFLWHQIRCILGVLLLVGQGKETANVIDQLLDVQKHPRKPQYNMGLDMPLNLFHCSYDIPDESWVCAGDELKSVIAHLQAEWTVHSIKTTMIKDCLNELESTYAKLCSKNETGDADCDLSDKDRVCAYSDCLLQGVKPRNYTPLMKRGTCSSLEERIEYHRKKRKVESDSGTKE